MVTKYCHIPHALQYILTKIIPLSVVLNDKQRVAKRKLIEENRERRKQESVKMKLKHEQCYHDFLTDEDRGLIDDIVNAYEQTGVNTPKPWTLVSVTTLTQTKWVQNNKKLFTPKH